MTPVTCHACTLDTMKVSPIGILFAIHLLVAGYFSWIICFSVGLPLLILSSILPFFNNVMSFVTSFVMTTFMQSIIFFVEHIYGTNITTSGDQINNIDPKTHQPIPLILISNNRTQIDFIFLWSLFERSNLLTFLKIVVLSKVSSIPLIGWSCQFFQYIFLDKASWDSDKTNIIHSIQSMSATAPTILIFPEGTDLCDGIMKSNEYGMKNNLSVKKHVLHPRINGTQLLLQQFMKSYPNNKFKIYDLTMLTKDYKDNQITSPESLAAGTMPWNVHIDVQEIPLHSISSILQEQEQEKKKDAFKTWLRNRFDRKEQMLNQYYIDGKETFSTKQRLLSKRFFPSIRILFSIILIWIAVYYYFIKIQPFILSILVGVQLIINLTFGGVHYMKMKIDNK